MSSLSPLRTVPIAMGKFSEKKGGFLRFPLFFFISPKAGSLFKMALFNLFFYLSPNGKFSDSSSTTNFRMKLRSGQDFRKLVELRLRFSVSLKKSNPRSISGILQWGKFLFFPKWGRMSSGSVLVQSFLIKIFIYFFFLPYIGKGGIDPIFSIRLTFCPSCAVDVNTKS